MAKRKYIGKKVRFEVLKRDSFTCQYCGKMPPDTILHIDHIKPVSKGGDNSILNLITSCQECNSGKSNTELSDDSAVKKQQNQLKDLAEKKVQIEMMIEWKDSLLESEELLVDSIESRVNTYLEAYDMHVSEHGRSEIRKAVKKFGYETVINAVERFYITDSDFSKGWGKAVRHANKNLNKKSIHYIKGILNNRIANFNQKRFYAEMNRFEHDEHFLDAATRAAKDCTSLSNFFDMLEV